MTAKKAKLGSSTHDRLAHAWHERPLAVLGAIATVVTILAGVGPVTTALFGYYATQADLIEHKESDALAAARQAVRDWRIEATLARNRVNDCDIIKDRGKAQSDLERRACAQYREELSVAQQRYYKARETVAELNKEKPDSSKKE